MYTTVRAQKQKFKQQKESVTQPTLDQKPVLAKICNNRTMKFRNRCLQRKSRVTSHPNLLQLFPKTWVFWQILIVFTAVHSGQSTLKVGRGLENDIQSATKTEKNLDTISFMEATFSSSYEGSKSKQRFYWNFALAFPTLFESTIPNTIRK